MTTMRQFERVVRGGIAWVQKEGWTLIYANGCDAVDMKACALAAILLKSGDIRPGFVSDETLVNRTHATTGITLHNAEAFLCGFDGQTMPKTFAKDGVWVDRKTPMAGKVREQAKRYFAMGRAFRKEFKPIEG